MKLQKLVLLGVGANNSDVLDAVREVNRVEPTFELLGYLTSDGAPAAKESLKLECLGDHASARTMPEDVKFIGLWGGVGCYWRVAEFFDSLQLSEDRFASVVHPMAYVSPQSTIGRGSVVLAGCAVGADARIGNWVCLLQNVTLGHDDVVEDCCCITSGACFSGGVHVEQNCYIGTNSTIVNGVTLGRQCLIGAGALIRYDVPPREVWAGSPARKLYDLDEWMRKSEQRSG